MADKLGLSNEIKEIKLGKSFGKGEHPCFHTFRYDFMPASLDTTKRATVHIGEGHQVTVTVPHIEGSGTANTVFKGSKKPYQKECVLIIDHNTGEITLEKLNCNVQLKKTRAEGSSKIRSNTPVDINFNSKKSPAHKLSPKQKPHANLGRSSPIQKCSPLPKSPLSNQPSPNSCTNPSMPCFNLPSTKASTIPEASTTHTKTLTTWSDRNDRQELDSVRQELDIVGQECDIVGQDRNENIVDVPEVGVLSSSSSSDSSSSEESSDSSSSDNEEMPETPMQQDPGVSNGFGDSPKTKEMPNSHSSSSNLSMPSANFLPSMPKFSDLSEDLKLSESDSDSDG